VFLVKVASVSNSLANRRTASSSLQSHRLHQREAF